MWGSPAVHVEKTTQKQITRHTPHISPSSRIIKEKSSFLYQLKRFYVVFGSVLIVLTIGTIFGFGNVLPYLASYMTNINLSKPLNEYTDQQLSNQYNSYLNSCNWIYRYFTNYLIPQTHNSHHY